MRKRHPRAKPRVQRTPKIAISSDEDDNDDDDHHHSDPDPLQLPIGRTCVVGVKVQNQTLERQRQELNNLSHANVLLHTRTNTDYSSSSQDSLSDDENGEHSLYDWLASESSSRHLINDELNEHEHKHKHEHQHQHQQQSILNTTASKPSMASPMPSSEMRRSSFSPPGILRSLTSTQCDDDDNNDGIRTYHLNNDVKDTHLLSKKKVNLPIQKPKVTNGNWLQYRIMVNNYILLESLGKGSFGEVKLCKEKITNELFAIKIVNKLNPNAIRTCTALGLKSMRLDMEVNAKVNIEYNDDVRREVAIMKKLRHENVIRLYEVIDDPRKSSLYLVIEYMERGDLMQIIEKESMNDEQTWDILRQVIRGLNYLHCNNIIHFDLKPSNILVDSHGTVKLSDLGISRIICDGDLLTEHIGTPAFMAPEIIASEESFDGKLADLYSVGATAYYVRFGKPAFKGRSQHDLYQRILHDPVQFPAATNANANVNAAVGLRKLIQGLMAKTPSIRYTMKELIENPWLQTRPGGENQRVERDFYHNERTCNGNIKVSHIDTLHSISSIAS